VAGQEIKTTGEHPFWVQGKGWTPVNELQPGDLLRGDDGQLYLVESVTATDEWLPVYNARIADYHTYFVCAPDGNVWLWAHNACSGTSGNNRFAQYGKARHDALSNALWARNHMGETLLLNGKRVDGIKLIKNKSGDFVQAIVYELKPKNARAIARGLKQLEDYIPEVRKLLTIDNVRGVLLKYPGMPK
jgi:hypothetical protein